MAGKPKCDGRVLPPDGMPLDYFLAVMRDPTVGNDRRDRMAMAAAPYCHPRRYDARVGKKELKAAAAKKAGKGTVWEKILAPANGERTAGQ